VAEILDRVGLAGKEKLRPSSLSGGEQQRVAIARAVVGNPTLLLADEPTGNLDSVTGQSVMELLRAVHKETADRILIVVTHDMEIARSFDRIIVLHDGRIVGEEGREGRINAG